VSTSIRQFWKYARLQDSSTIGSVIGGRWPCCCGSLAAAALILAGAGVYATLAFAVGQRLREMAIRSALGASTSRLASTVVIDGLKPGLVGKFIGLGLGMLVGRFLVGLLYGVPTIDVRSLAVATALMLLVMRLACVGPTRRALHENPTRLLREEGLG